MKNKERKIKKEKYIVEEDLKLRKVKNNQDNDDNPCVTCQIGHGPHCVHCEDI